MARQVGATQTVTASASGAAITLPTWTTGVRYFAISVVNTGGAADAYVYNGGIDSAGTTSEVVPSTGTRYDSPMYDVEDVTNLRLYAATDSACRVTCYEMDAEGNR